MLGAGLHNQLFAHFSRLACHDFCIGSLKPAILGVFTAWKLANTINFT